MVKSFLLGKSMCMTPEAYEGSGLKGSSPWGLSGHTPSPPVFPSTIMGDTYHNNFILVCATGVLSPPEVMSSPSATWRVVCGCCPYEGLGHWLGVGGCFRNTLGSLRPLSSLCSLGKVPKNLFFLFYLDNL